MIPFVRFASGCHNIPPRMSRFSFGRGAGRAARRLRSLRRTFKRGAPFSLCTALLRLFFLYILRHCLHFLWAIRALLTCRMNARNLVKDACEHYHLFRVPLNKRISSGILNVRIVTLVSEALFLGRDYLYKDPMLHFLYLIFLSCNIGMWENCYVTFGFSWLHVWLRMREICKDPILNFLYLIFHSCNIGIWENCYITYIHFSWLHV